MRALVVLLMLIAAAAAGHFVPKLLNISSKSDIQLAFPDRKFTASPNLGCKVITEARAFENRFGPTANAYAGPGTESLALTLSGDRKTLSILYAYDVGIGVTERGLLTDFVSRELILARWLPF